MRSVVGTWHITHCVIAGRGRSRGITLHRYIKRGGKANYMMRKTSENEDKCDTLRNLRVKKGLKLAIRQPTKES